MNIATKSKLNSVEFQCKDTKLINKAANKAVKNPQIIFENDIPNTEDYFNYYDSHSGFNSENEQTPPPPTPPPFNENDSDFIQNDTKTHAKRTEIPPFELTINCNITRCYVNCFLTEIQDDIKLFLIGKSKRCLIVAPTGTGKNHVILSHCLDLLKNAKDEEVIILTVPTNNNLIQSEKELQQKFQKLQELAYLDNDSKLLESANIVLMTGKTNWRDCFKISKNPNGFHTDKNGKTKRKPFILVASVDQLAHLRESKIPFNPTHLFVDEFHSFVSHSKFREKTNEIQTYLSLYSECKLVAFTATPPLFVNVIFDSILKIDYLPESTFKPNQNVFFYEDYALRTLVKRCVRSLDSGRKVLLCIKSSDTLIKIKLLVQNHYTDLGGVVPTSFIYSSKTKDSTEMQNLVETGILTHDLNLSTNILQDGFSIKNDSTDIIDQIYIYNDKTPEAYDQKEVIQFARRIRNQPNNDLFIYAKRKNHKTYKNTKDSEFFDWAYKFSINAYKDCLENGYSEITDKAKDAIGDTVVNETSKYLDNHGNIDILKVLYISNEFKNKSTPFETFKSKIITGLYQSNYNSDLLSQSELNELTQDIELDKIWTKERNEYDKFNFAQIVELCRNSETFLNSLICSVTPYLDDKYYYNNSKETIDLDTITITDNLGVKCSLTSEFLGLTISKFVTKLTKRANEFRTFTKNEKDYNLFFNVLIQMLDDGTFGQFKVKYKKMQYKFDDKISKTSKQYNDFLKDDSILKICVEYFGTLENLESDFTLDSLFEYVKTHSKIFISKIALGRLINNNATFELLQRQVGRKKVRTYNISVDCVEQIRSLINLLKEVSVPPPPTPPPFNDSENVESCNNSDIVQDKTIVQDDSIVLDDLE